MIKGHTIRRRNYRNLAVFGLGVFVAVFLFVFLAQKFGKMENNTNAANLANFQAGYIISDYQMTDYTSMTEGEIQNFLWSKGRCYNTNFSGVGTRVNYFSDHTPPTTWHVSNGHTVCLAEENMNGESAAHIIWQAAQDYHINPKVLIVLIQKETGLITDPIPNSWDYQRTAGYGCPDTAACSEKYYGFKNQVRNAARLFRIVMDGNSSYYPIGYNNIRYSPNPDCGSSVVYIQNLATSALYRYTPYQPNAGALAAGYGTAPCGAYGNRNFYSYFEDWFGYITETQKPAVEAKSNYEKTVEDGVYQLVPKNKTSKTIDIYGGVRADMGSGKISLYDRRNKNVDNQLFEVKYDANNGYYSIVNPTSKLAFDVDSNKTRNSTPVGLWSQHNECNQDWLLNRDKDGYYTIVSRCSSRVLDATSDGNIVIYDSHGGDNQKWQLVKYVEESSKPIEEGIYQMTPKAYSDKTIDIYGGVWSGMSTGKLQIYDRRDTNIDNQKFQVKYDVTDGYYAIVNPLTGISLDVTGGSVVNSSAVGLWPYRGTCNQDWSFAKDKEGYYTISSRCSNRVLDATSDGNIVIYDSHGGNNQKWQMIKSS